MIKFFHKRKTCMLCGTWYNRNVSRCPTCWGWADKEPEMVSFEPVQYSIDNLQASYARIELLRANQITFNQKREILGLDPKS